MKRLVILLGIIFTATFLNFSMVSAEDLVKNRMPTDYTPQKPASEMEPTFIDDIAVPYDVLVYAQVVYQGYAVTQAEETTWNGSKAYQLRIDNDSNTNDANGMYLLYDESWKLIDNKPLYAPLPKNRKIGVEQPKPIQQTEDSASQNVVEEPEEPETNNSDNEEQVEEPVEPVDNGGEDDIEPEEPGVTEPGTGTR